MARRASERAVLVLEVFVLVALVFGCSTARAPSQGQTASVSPAPQAENVSGDVHQPTTTQMEESLRESAVETGGGQVAGDVSTVRYGLDEHMAALLERYGDQTVGTLAKLAASAVVAVAGLLLWALNTNAPSNELLRLVGQIVGLAALVGGPVFVWAVL